MIPLSLLSLLALAVTPALGDLNCKPFYPPNFGGKHTAHLQLSPNFGGGGSVPALGNITAHYPVTIETGNATSVLFSLQTCTSASLGLRHKTSYYPSSCKESKVDCSVATEWTGVRLINHATGHCLRVQNPNPHLSDPELSNAILAELDFRLCDPYPAPSNASQLWVVSYEVDYDAQGRETISGLSVDFPYRSDGDGAVWQVSSKDNVTTYIDYFPYDTGYDAVLLPA